MSDESTRQHEREPMAKTPYERGSSAEAAYLKLRRERDDARDELASLVAKLGQVSAELCDAQRTIERQREHAVQARAVADGLRHERDNARADRDRLRGDVRRADDRAAEAERQRDEGIANATESYNRATAALVSCRIMASGTKAALRHTVEALAELTGAETEVEL